MKIQQHGTARPDRHIEPVAAQKASASSGAAACDAAPDVKVGMAL